MAARADEARGRARLRRGKPDAASTRDALSEVRRSALANLAGAVALRVLEALPAPARDAIRLALWRRHAYLVVTPGERLVREALRGYPEEVRRVCAGATIERYDDRGGGGFDPDGNAIRLAAGVETYESRRQVFASACHELFHYVCWNHPLYRADEDRGFPALLRALADTRPIAAGYARYASFVRGFLTQGDHANAVEFFADIPTNFPDARELPPSLARHFGPLITGDPPPEELLAPTAPEAMSADLAGFQTLLGG